MEDAMDRARVTRAALLVTAAALLAGGGACSSDIFDLTVDLKPQAYAFDFGAAQGTIPTVACDPTASACMGTLAAVDGSPVTGVPTQVTVSIGCDAATARCFAQADTRIAYTVDVLTDDSFQSAVERRATTFVRVADLAFSIPTNTLTFDVPQIDVFVGPPGATGETDPGVLPVDSIRPVPAGTPVGDPRHLTLADGSEARDLIEQNIQERQPFVFIVALAPRVEAGAPIPAGALEVDLFPRLVIGLPR
jgi:hypothetical protein